MMARTFVALFAACAVATAQSEFSPRDVDYSIVLYPDGSGTFTAKLSDTKGDLYWKTMELELSRGGHPAERAFEDQEGIVAYAEPKIEDIGDKKQISMVGYFEDINKLKFRARHSGRFGEKTSFEFKRDDKGFVLAFHDDWLMKIPEFIKVYATLGESGKEFVKDILNDTSKVFSHAVSVTVFGSIGDIKGFLSKDGRKASSKVSLDLLWDACDGKEEAVKKIESISGGAKITWAKNEMSDADAAAFKKELEAAKENWKKIREEMKKKASDK